MPRVKLPLIVVMVPWLALVAVGGCGPMPMAPTPVASPTPPTMPASPPGTPATSSPEPAPPAEPSDPTQNAEPLPAIPRADPQSKLTPLLPDKSLYLETLPNGKKRVLLVAEVCIFKPDGVMFDPPLEVFLCRKQTKEHESVVRTATDARFIHAALEAAGAVKGSPVRFLDPVTGAESYKPASGEVIKVSVHYRKDGQLRTHPAQDWIRDRATGQSMTHDWVFAGSRFVKNPDAPPDAPDYYAANAGEVIAVSNFPDSMLDLPVRVSQVNTELAFEAYMSRIPPLLSQVWVILEPTGVRQES